ncbi:transposase [Mesorhizobium sp. M0184]|uniref:transposase n=1 Tax=Mesorhizobium sp. M0184 TaxID=2956906 RepID=UPI003337BBF1
MHCIHRMDAPLSIRWRFQSLRIARATLKWQQPFAYLILDARYEKLREAGIVMSERCRSRSASTPTEGRQILAVEMPNRESR